jgi:hypothetical protein
MEQPITPISQSNNVVTEEIIHYLVNTVEDLKKQIHETQTKKIIEELQLPSDILKDAGVLPEAPHRLRQGTSWRALLESEIKDAQSKCNTAADCARYLGISYVTYKKHCDVYGLFKTNQWGKGSKKRYWNPNKGKYPLNRILQGEFPEYPAYRLKDLLIRSEVKKPECEQCGYKDRRITDNKMPLILNFEDGNSKNHKSENLRILCYNCTFTCGRGYIRNNRVDFHFNDPDRLQGSKRKLENRF